MLSSLTFASWNANHLAAGASELLHEAFAIRSRCDFIFVQEGWEVTKSNQFILRDYIHFPGTDMNGVTSFVRSELAPDCKLVLNSKHVQVLVYCGAAGSMVFVNCHLPCEALGIPLDPILSLLECCLDELWISRPWAHLFVSGDLNIEVPSSSGGFGPCAGGGCMSSRVARVSAFADRFNLVWTISTTFCPAVRPGRLPISIAPCSTRGDSLRTTLLSSARPQWEKVLRQDPLSRRSVEALWPLPAVTDLQY